MSYVGIPEIGAFTGCRKDFTSLSAPVGIVEGEGQVGGAVWPGEEGRGECRQGINVAVTTEISAFT